MYLKEPTVPLLFSFLFYQTKHPQWRRIFIEEHPGIKNYLTIQQEYITLIVSPFITKTKHFSNENERVQSKTKYCITTNDRRINKLATIWRQEQFTKNRYLLRHMHYTRRLNRSITLWKSRARAAVSMFISIFYPVTITEG